MLDRDNEPRNKITEQRDHHEPRMQKQIEMNEPKTYPMKTYNWDRDNEPQNKTTEQRDECKNRPEETNASMLIKKNGLGKKVTQVC